MEKTGEELTYLQGGTNVTRMDYLSPLFNELRLLAWPTEKLLGIEVPAAGDVDPHAACAELNRIASHLLFLATNGMDIGAVVDDALRLARARGGAALLREGHRPADEPQLHPRPAAWPPTCPTAGATTCCGCSTLIPPRLDEYDILMTDQPIWRERLQGVGVITAAGGAWRSAPPGRSCARRACRGTCAATCRTSPTTRSTSTSSSARYGDCFDRYAIRLNEIRESIEIVPPDPRQDADGRLPDPGQEGHAAAAGPHRRVDGGADPPLQDLHRGLQGARGRGLRARSSRRGASSAATSCRDGSVEARTACTSAAPSFVNLQALPAHDARRPHRRRRRRHLVRRPDPRRGRSLMAAAAPTDERRARRRDHRAATRGPQSALDPAAATWPRSRTATSPTTPWSTSPSCVGVTPAEVLGTASFYEMFKLEPVGQYLRQRLHQHLLPAHRRLRSCSSTPRRRLGRQGGRHDRRRHVHARGRASASRPAPRRRACRSTTATATRSRRSRFDQLIDDLRAGKLDGRDPRHGTLARVRQKVAPDRWANTGIEAQAGVDALDTVQTE